MELRDYIKMIRQSLALVIGITVISAVLAAIWSVNEPVKYESSVTAVIDKPSVPAGGSNDFRYDKYYALQASALFADSLAAWLSSPAGVREAYEKAQLPVPDISLTKLSKTFRVNREPNSSLHVSITDTDQSKSEKLANAALAALEEQLQAQRSDEDPNEFFTLERSQVVTGRNVQNTVLNTILGLIGGLILGLIAAFLRAYLKEK